MVKKYVLTGAPNTGKTTTINELAKSGFETVPESARILIKEQLSSGGDLLPWCRQYDFVCEVLPLRLKLESNIKSNTAFIDRGIIDGVAYAKLQNVPVPLSYSDAIEKTKYEKIFLLEPVPGYFTDNIRREDAATASVLQDILYQTYLEYGYEPVKVPFKTVEERVQFILSHCDLLV